MENPFELLNERLCRIENLLTELQQRIEQSKQQPAQETFLTITNLMKYTGLNKSSIYKKTSTREIPHYKRGKRLFFKRTEIDEWIGELRIKTMDEIEIEAATYLMKHKR